MKIKKTKKGKCLRETLAPRIICPFPVGETQRLKCCRLGNVNAETLAQLVDLYVGEWRCRLCYILTGFTKLSFDDAVKYAGRGKEFDNISHICHLCCLNTVALEAGRDTLLENINSLRRCITFDQLYNKIKKLVEPIQGLGPMYDYDVALRIGAKQRLLPTSVYLQRGALEGARNLFGNAVAGVIELAEEHSRPEFKRLAAHEIEDFLCIFKNHLQLYQTIHMT
jgi:hypothetical protein